MKDFLHSSSPRRPVSCRGWWVAAGLLALLGVAPGSARAEALKSAQVSRVFNDVRVLPENQPARPAVVADTITGRAAVQTGAASRTELTFSDRTLTRLGADSYFSFVNGTRDMNLGSGTMLLQVPKGAGGATIHTAGVTAGITGTTLMVEYNPKSYSKIVVLEGVVRVSLTGRLGESVLVHAGEILIVPAKAKTLPEPVSLDLKVLYATSGLITGFEPLPSRNLIDREVTRQTKKIGAGQLQGASLFIAGRGTQVQAENLGFIAAANNRITAQQGADSPISLGGRRNSNAGKYGPLPDIAGNGTAQSGIYEINTTTTIRTDPYITTNGVLGAGRIYRAGTVDEGGNTSSVDGSAGTYLLGAPATTQFTLASTSPFDTYFNAVGNIAAFRFTSLAVLGTPVSISTAGGPTNLALIADAGITDGSPQQGNTANTVISLNGLGELLLATRQGSITLSGSTTFQNTDGTAPNLTLYAQGGSLTLGAATSLNVGGGINLHSDTGMTLDGAARAAGNIEALSYGPITTGANSSFVSTGAKVDIATMNGPLTFNGTIQSGGTTNLVALGSGDLTVNGTVTTTGAATDSNAVVEASGGNMTLNGTVSPYGSCLVGTNNQQGTSSGGNFTVAAGALFSSFMADTTVQVEGGSFTLNGSGQGYTSLVVSADGNITLGANSSLACNSGPLTLTSGGSITANGVTTAAGEISWNAPGALVLGAGSSLTSSLGGVTLGSTAGGLTVDGAVRSAQGLQATAAGDIGVGANAGLVSSNGQVYLQSTAGALDFNGSATAQAQAVLQASGNVTTGRGSNLASNGGNAYLYSTAGTVTNNGTVTAAGTVYLEGQGIVQNGTLTGTGGLSFLSNADLTESGTATTAASATVQAFGALNVNNAVLSADLLKLQTFGNNGVLVIGGSSVLTGNTQLNLFASGNGGRIEFAGNTTLNSNVAAVLTASVIRIDNNVTVTINGPTALLYTNTLQFTGSGGDGSTSGAFGGSGAVLAGSYTSGPNTAVATTQGGSAAAGQKGVTSTVIKPTPAKPVAPSYDGRYGLAALVAGSAPGPGATTTTRGSARPPGTSKTTIARPVASANEQGAMARATVLR